MYLIKFIFTLLTAVIYIGTCLLTVDPSKLHGVKKGLATVAISKPNSFSHIGNLLAFGYVANR